ncbi:MAG: GNAT family N-acetyltransferase [Candidatus Melainabacteria bacterium]|nr:GNAT family N-acetyltransferase [Candidatus Melainabacteria bacterium]
MNHSGIQLETKRLLLREFVFDDWIAVHSYASDPEVVRFMVWGPNTEDNTKQFIKDMLDWQIEQPRKVFDFAVQTKVNASLIGSCGVHVTRTISEGSSQSIALATRTDYNVHPSSFTQGKHAAMGYCFSKDIWGQGYATEAAGALIRFGFEQLGLHKIFATCDVENKGSARVLEKIGMKREGHLLEDVKIKGRWRDSYLYAVTNTEWQTSST